MDRMTTIAVGIEMAKEAPRKNYLLIENNETHLLSLTNSQLNLLDWLDNVGLLYDYTIEEIKTTDFEII